MSKSHTQSFRSSRSLSDFGIVPHNNIIKTKTAKVKKFLLDLATTTGKVDLNGVKQALAHNGVVLTNQQEFLELALTIKQRIKVEVIMEWIKFGKPTGNKDQITATFEAPKNMNALIADNLSQSSMRSTNKIPRPPSQQRSIVSAGLNRRVSTPVMNLNDSFEQADNRSEKSLIFQAKPMKPVGNQRPVSAVLSRRPNQNQTMDDNMSSISRSTVKNFRPIKKLPNEQQKSMGQRAFSNLLDKTFQKEKTKAEEKRINTQYSSNNRIRTLDRNSTVNSSFDRSDTSSQRDGSFDRKLIDTINDEEDEPRLVPNILVYKPSKPLTKGTGSYQELVVELIHDLQKKTVEYEFMFRMLKILMRQTHKYNTKRIFRDVYEVEANQLKPVLGPELYTRIIDLSTNKEGKVSLKLMSSLVDKYKHAPHYVTEFKNSSHRFQEIALFGSKIQGKVRKVHENCQLLSRRIEEKFKKMGKAYRFFDLDKTGFVTFPSFKHGLDLLGLRMSEEEAKELFNYLDGKKDGILDHDEFCDILEERRLMKKVKANHDLTSTTQSTATDQQQMTRSSKDSPFLTFITTNLKAQPKFVDFRKETSSDILSTSYISSAHIKQLKKNPTLRRKFSLVGSATKSNASLPSDTDERFKYGVKSKATESMKDIMANNYQREWIEKAQEKEQKRIEAEKERRSCPKRWTTDASMLRGAFVSSMIARKKQGDSLWKMTRFSKAQPKVNSHNANGSRRGSIGNNATMLDYSLSQSSFHLENPRDLNISVL